MKNIVLCSDGTGNTAVKGRGTNVWKLYEALDLTGRRLGRDVPEQVAFYDDGVGTQSFKPLKILSGAFGIGLKRNVLDLYRALCVSYRPGDRIFLFGFSRGAYTVRMLSGLVTTCGIVRLDRVASMDDLSATIRKAYGRFSELFRDPHTGPVDEFRRMTPVWRHAVHAPDGKARIRFIGVWDTVDAYGFPVDEIAQFWNHAVRPFWFPNRLLPELVERGCHAISIDDERRSFHPVLWEADPTGGPFGRERAEQVWFPGVHSNVGGGYPKQGMSLVSLDWMMARAEEEGLRFLAAPRRAYRDAANPHDQMYDSRAGLAAYYSYSPRPIAELCEASGIETPRIHESAVARARLATDGYAPGNIPAGAVVESSGDPVTLPDMPSAAAGKVKTLEAVETLTSALTVTLVVTGAAVLAGWRLSGGGSLPAYVSHSPLPAWLTALTAAALSMWGAVRGLSERFVGARQQERREARPAVSRWRIWSSVGASLVASLIVVGLIVGKLGDLGTPWFAWAYAIAAVALAALTLVARSLRASLGRLYSRAWLEWIQRQPPRGGTGCAVVLLALVVAAATATGVRAERLPIDHLGAEDGLPHSRVRRVVQDERGLIWLATVEGLVRYDGTELRTYGPADGLGAAFVNDVLPTRDGSVWIATEGGGVQRLSGSRHGASPGSVLERVAFERDGDGARAAVMLEDRRGRIWLGADDGLFVLDRDAEPAAFGRVPGEAGRRDVRSLAEDAAGAVWAGTSDGLVRIGPDGSSVRFRVVGGAAADRYRSLYFDRDGRLWIGHDSGLIVAGPDAVDDGPGGAGERSLDVRDVNVADPRRPFPLPGPGDPPFRITVDGVLDSHKVRRVAAGSDGTVWIASVGNGLIGVSGDRVRRYDKRHGLRDDTLNDIAEDRAGGLWLASDAAGAMRIDWGGFVSYGDAEGLAHTFVTSLTEDRAGRVVVVSGNFRVNVFGDERFAAAARPLPDGVDDPYFWDEGLLTRRGEWWLPTTRGLYRFPPHDDPLAVGRLDPLAVYGTRDGLPSLQVGAMYDDADGSVWVATVGAGAALARWEPHRDGFVPFGTAAGLPGGTVTAIAREPGGDLWIALEDGALLRLRGERFEPVAAGAGIPAPPIRELHFDDAGRLWIGSEGGGLGRIDRPGVDASTGRVYGTADGMPSDSVTSVTSDRLGRVWAGTLRGVARIDPVTDVIRAFSVADGLANDEIRAAARDRDGDLWFGTLDGVSRLRPAAEAAAPPPPVSIGDVRVDGTPRPVDEFGSTAVAGIDLGPGRHHVEIDYFAVPFEPGAPLRYEYRLAPGDDAWIDAGGRRSVTFVNLPPGRYRFEVRASDGAGEVSPVAASVAWAIAPPFWRSAWFVALVLAALAVVATAWHRGRVRRAVAVERLRTRIATDLHDDIGSSLTHVAILSEVARRSLPGDGVAAGASLERIADVSRETIDTMSDIVWALNPERDRVADLVRRMRRFAGDMLDARGIAVALDAPERGRGLRLDAETKRQVFLVFKEAVHNAARHSGCTRVGITVRIAGDRLVLRVRDDGRGFAAPAADDGERDGQGIGSMRARAAALGGELTCRSAPGRGTEIRLDVPVGGGAR